MKLILSFLLLSTLTFGQVTPVFETGIRIGNSTEAPMSGDVRWSGEAFEGFDGNSWKSFTQTQVSSGETITDIDGNLYGVVEIAGQKWMRENLKTSRYKDGKNMLQLTFSDDWNADREGAWCWYWNDKQYDTQQGKIYNYFAVINSSGICPEGWKVPSASDWEELIHFLGPSIAANRMKQVGNSQWSSTSASVDNNSGFTGVPSGFRSFSGVFESLDFFNNSATFWTSTENTSSTATVRNLFGSEGSIDIDVESKNSGFSVRCIKG